MKIRKLSVFLAFFFLFTLTAEVYSLTTVTPTQGQSLFIDLSLKNLNLIKFPSGGVRVYTSSKLLDIKLDEGNVFVKFMEGELPSPQEVFFVTPSGVYSMILIPKEMPAQTVIVRISEGELSDALSWETSHSYIAGLKELIKAMYEGKPPRGFSVKEVGQEVSRWGEVKTVLKQIYAGATLQGEIYELINVSKEPVRFVEKEFYEEGILAVSIDRHELKPAEKTEVYLVKKTRAQREFEKVLQKSNPLDVLKEK
jgi:type-F conjugative transfer system secretin TraK